MASIRIGSRSCATPSTPGVTFPIPGCSGITCRASSPSNHRQAMRALLLILLLAMAARAFAADEDAAALSLADQTPKTTRAASDWRVFAEAREARSALRGGGNQHDENLYRGVHYDTTFAPGWR